MKHKKTTRLGGFFMLGEVDEYRTFLDTYEAAQLLKIAGELAA